MKRSKESWQGQNKKGIRELRAAFDSATSSDEKLKIFKKIEARLDEHQLGGDCWKLTVQLHNESQDPLKILHFGKRALNISLNNENDATLAVGSYYSSIATASILNMLGSACFALKRFNECLSYLNWADRNLSHLKVNDSVLGYLRNTHLELCRVKRGMGKGEEAVLHLIKVSEINEKLMSKTCVELGTAYKDVSDAYMGIDNSKQALPFALKAMEIYRKRLSDDSEEITMLRMSLGSIYTGLEEYDKALEHNRLCLRGLKSMENTSLLLKAEVQRGNILLGLGRCEEAIVALKHVISQAETSENRRARFLACMCIARVFYRLEKLSDARKYIKMGVRVLEKKELDPLALALGFMSISSLYEEMKEYEMAISLVQKTLNIPELPQHHLAKCSLRLFSLISLSGTEEKEISSLEEVVERLKEISGPNHCDVGYAYAKLGETYLRLDRPETAAECLVRAKEIFNVSLGPQHCDSLRVSQILSLTYVTMKSFGLAVKIQEKLVADLKGLGLSEQDEVDKAVQILNRMKREGSSATNSKYGVSDDEK